MLNISMNDLKSDIESKQNGIIFEPLKKLENV